MTGLQTLFPRSSFVGFDHLFNELEWTAKALGAAVEAAAKAAAEAAGEAAVEAAVQCWRWGHCQGHLP